MKAGGDNNGIWTLIESHLRYVSLRGSPTCLLHFFSIRAIISQVSYVLPLVIAFTGRNGAVQRIFAFGRERALERLKMGADRKDLFYHLVRARDPSYASSWPHDADFNRVAKLCLKRSALLLVMLRRMED